MWFFGFMFSLEKNLYIISNVFFNKMFVIIFTIVMGMHVHNRRARFKIYSLDFCNVMLIVF